MKIYNGRFRQEHPLLYVWNKMMERCGHRKGASPTQLKSYACRGITVCEDWWHFRNFESWCLANGWKKGLQLDRIDNDRGYCPNNCRFVSAKANCRNRRNTHMFNGRSIADWYDLGHVDGLNYKTFHYRFVGLNWPMCRALYQPVKHKKAS